MHAGGGELRTLGGDGKVAACNKLLRAVQKESTKEAEILSKDYRLSPADGVLERYVMITRAAIWVPVMPAVVIPSALFAEVTAPLTWRRFAFERAHATFLEPHRSSGCFVASVEAYGILAIDAS